MFAQRFNARVTKRLSVERPLPGPLPPRRTSDYVEWPARISEYAIFTVKGVRYGAPSQHISHR